MPSIDEIKVSIASLRDRLIGHPVYRSLGSPEALRVFMEHHVFAVWDFMTLLKSLQRDLTCVDVPWLPRGDREARRLINAIVLAEESDEDGRGGHASHFESYLDAMSEAGANTGPIEGFLQRLRDGHSIPMALHSDDIPEAAREFVQTTWSFVDSGSTAAVASAFTLGREGLIPDLFRGLVDRFEDLGLFRRYLDRHIDLDGDEHGPMADRMLLAICGDDVGRWRDARYAAEVALEARLALWDGMQTAVGGDPFTLLDLGDHGQANLAG